MSKCLIARTAVVALRKKGAEAREVTLVFPARWKRTTLLSYVRREHPGETVRIIDWRSTSGFGHCEPLLWLANPDGFADYSQGHPWEQPDCCGSRDDRQGA